jgi:hypothetical protein
MHRNALAGVWNRGSCDAAHARAHACGALRRRRGCCGIFVVVRVVAAVATRVAANKIIETDECVAAAAAAAPKSAILSATSLVATTIIIIVVVVVVVVAVAFVGARVRMRVHAPRKPPRRRRRERRSKFVVHLQHHCQRHILQLTRLVDQLPARAIGHGVVFARVGNDQINVLCKDVDKKYKKS